MVYERASMSTNTGRAPVYRMAAAVATKVNGTVITSAPGPMPAASRARCRALVPAFNATPPRGPLHRAAAVGKGGGARLKNFHPPQARLPVCDDRLLVLDAPDEMGRLRLKGF